MSDVNDQGGTAREVGGLKDLVLHYGFDCIKLFLLSKLRVIGVFQAEGVCNPTWLPKRWLLLPQRRAACSWTMVSLRRAEEAIAPGQANDGGGSAQGGGNWDNELYSELCLGYFLKLEEKRIC